MEPARQHPRYLDDATPVTTQTQYHTTLGKPVQVIDAENSATALAYTSRGEIERITDPLGHSTQLAYTLAGNLAETRDPLGNVSRMEADGAGRTVRPPRPTTPQGLRLAVFHRRISNQPMTSPALIAPMPAMTWRAMCQPPMAQTSPDLNIRLATKASRMAITA